LRRAQGSLSVYRRRRRRRRPGDACEMQPSRWSRLLHASIGDERVVGLGHGVSWYPSPGPGWFVISRDWPALSSRLRPSITPSPASAMVIGVKGGRDDAGLTSSRDVDEACRRDRGSRPYESLLDALPLEWRSWRNFGLAHEQVPDDGGEAPSV
jgi:hypothetical protein